MTGVVLALDVGGTNIRGEALTADLVAVAARRTATPLGDGDAVLDAIAGLCEGLLGDVAAAGAGPVAAVGVAVPGVVDTARGRVRLAANLGWRDTPVAELLGARLGVPVLLHHDVAVAGLAEQRLGAGVGVEDLLCVFLGTGVAATLTVGGHVVGQRRGQGGGPSRGGHAGELGHVPIHMDGLLCGCGQRGCLEMYASARAIGDAYAQATGRVGATSRDVAAWLGTDPVADQVWSDALDALAHGLLGVITLLAPTRIVVGGGLAAAGDALLVPLRERLEATARVAVVPEIVPAGLGQRAGVVGAALATQDALPTTSPTTSRATATHTAPAATHTAPAAAPVRPPRPVRPPPPR